MPVVPAVVGVTARRVKVRVGVLEAVVSTGSRYAVVRRLAGDVMSPRLREREDRLRVVKATDHLDQAVATVNYWRRRGVPASRLYVFETTTRRSMGAGGYGA